MPTYYEDISIGDSRAFGSYEVTTEEIIEFAERYDPQPFHVDEEAAKDSMFGGLVASGWHTAAMTMRMLVENLMDETGVMGAVGVDDLRWTEPVRPGDVLRVETEVVDTEPYQPGIGLVHTATTTLNQDDEAVMEFTGLVLFERREE